MITFIPWMSNVAVTGQVLLMFSMGLGLCVADFTRIVQQPLSFAVGIFGQILVLPVAAYLIAVVLGLPAYLAIGLMIIAACPGGTTSNAFSFMARGDVALSISLTAISGVLAFVTTPLIISTGLAVFADQSTDLALPFIRTSVRVILVTAVPVAIGMFVRAKINLPWNPIRLSLFIVALAAILFPSISLTVAIPSISLTVANTELMRDALGLAALSAVTLNIMMLFAGWALAALFRLPRNQRKTIGLEVGLQNFGLAIVIIISFLDDPRLLITGLFYLPSMLITGGLFVLCTRNGADKDASHKLLLRPGK